MVTQLARRALLIGTAVLCPTGVLAQSSTGGLARVLECADIEREILRLECYDEAAASIRSEAEAVEASPSARSSGSAAAESGSRGAGDDRRAAEDRAAEDASSRGSAADETPRPSPPPVAAEREPDGAPAQSADRDDDDDDDGKIERQVTIVEVRTPVPGRAVFVTSEGEEFVQTSGRLRLFLPDLPFQANVRSGAVGGLFLTPEGTRRSIRIATRD